MNVASILQVVANTFGAAPDQSAAGPYLAAFLSSTAIEVAAVAALLAMVLSGGARAVLRAGALSHGLARVYRALDVLKLYKIVIPMACLSATLWIWSLIQQS
jgi:hypothetical protein